MTNEGKILIIQHSPNAILFTLAHMEQLFTYLSKTIAAPSNHIIFHLTVEVSSQSVTFNFWNIRYGGLWTRINHNLKHNVTRWGSQLFYIDDVIWHLRCGVLNQIRFIIHRGLFVWIFQQKYSKSASEVRRQWNGIKFQSKNFTSLSSCELAPSLAFIVHSLYWFNTYSILFFYELARFTVRHFSLLVMHYRTKIVESDPL